MSQSTSKLAIEGGTPAVRSPLPPMYPGGLRIGQEEEEAVLEVLRSKRLFRYYGPTPGPSKVAQLEKEFAACMGASYAVAVTSGSAALICALVGLGIGPGDEVIVPAYTWIASASAVVAVGGVPVIAECDESLTIDPADIERRITPRTKAIIPVHMRGAPCEMDAVMAVARKHGLKVLEDTAQADGASYHGKRLGSIGDAGAFSFQFNKIITCGEGGMVITNDREVWKRTVMYHDVIGGARNGIPEEEILPGVNFRMTELQGAVMLAQLRKLDGLLADMRRNKAMLKATIEEVAARKGIVFRKEHDPAGDAAICLIFYLPDAARANMVAEALQAEGVGAWVLYDPEHSDYHIYRYWTPIMQQRTWHPKGGPWRWHESRVHYAPDLCPRTLDLLGRAVHIDISPDLTNENIEEMAEGLNKVLSAEW
ncbi:MAG: DegT/DnrJ/EryC1/StrS family aminotransferase [Anaerolineae bacterium]|nr:DegT/DnrJ/EryC1/StrS family aminotransferase [Thermoflexales bacterium]MDW8406907.1 DegT/DnrJ/EryC1/StrS family aminotransferase [Anaerolineae bacterium]